MQTEVYLTVFLLQLTYSTFVLLILYIIFFSISFHYRKNEKLNLVFNEKNQVLNKDFSLEEKKRERKQHTQSNNAKM